MNRTGGEHVGDFGFDPFEEPLQDFDEVFGRSPSPTATDVEPERLAAGNAAANPKRKAKRFRKDRNMVTCEALPTDTRPAASASSGRSMAVPVPKQPRRSEKEKSELLHDVPLQVRRRDK